MQIQYYTVEETAKILKTKESTVRAYCREGKIPAVRIGRGYRNAREDLDQWLEQQKKSPELIHEEEKKLIITEARYRDVFENASDAIALFDIAGRLTIANPKFYELYGYTPEEAKGMHFARFVYSDDLPLATERFMLRMAGEDIPSRYEARAVDKKGQVFTVEINSSSFVKEGESSGVQAILRDVSEQREAEKALRESEARYRSVVEDQSELICRWLQNGQLTFVNEAYCRFFGKKQEELIGHSFTPLIPEEDQKIIEKHTKKLTLRNPVVTFEHRVINSNGEIRWIQKTDRLISNEKNHSIEHQCVGRDITEQKKAQERLRESEEMYKTLVKASPDSIAMTDLEGNIIYLSEQTLQFHGYKKAEELMGRNAFELIDPSDHERAKVDLQKILKKGTMKNLEYTLLRKDGTSFIGEMNTTLVRDAEKKPKAFLATVRDVTERKESEKEKEKLTRAIEASSEGVAILDENEKFTYMNQAFAKVHGYEPKELIGKGWSHLVPKDHAEKIETKIRGALKSAGRWQGSFEAVKKDGNKIWVSMSLTVFKDHKGKPTGFVNVLKGVLE